MHVFMLLCFSSEVPECRQGMSCRRFSARTLIAAFIADAEASERHAELESDIPDDTQN